MNHILMRRALLEDFENSIQKIDSVRLAMKDAVVLITDTNQLAYHDPQAPNDWVKIDGTFIKSDEKGEYEVGEFTLGNNAVVRTNNGLYSFIGYRIRFERVAEHIVISYLTTNEDEPLPIKEEQ